MSALEQAVKACRGLVSGLPHHHEVVITIRSDRVLCAITKYDRADITCCSSDQGEAHGDAVEETLSALTRTLAKHGDCNGRKR